MFLVYKGIKQQRGAALILALLIVSIVTILAATLASDFLVALRRVENQLHSQQAYAYLRGAEVMARQVMMDDFKKGGKTDHNSEIWLEADHQADLDQGVLKGRLSDLQGRFNINNLKKLPARGQQYTSDQLQFVRLLQQLPLEEPLDPIAAEDLARAVIDWIDDNDETDPRGGAETAYYSGLEKLPMRAANRELHSVSELLWVKGMTKEIYTALKPFITALPEGTNININTASVELLQALVENGSGSEGSRIRNDRDGEKNGSLKGFDTVNDFNASYLTAVGGGGTQAKPPDGVQVHSEYFLLSAQTIFLDRVFQMQSVLHRDAKGSIKVYARSYTDI